MGINNMIKINDNYYAKDTIKKVTPIIRTEENCVHYFQFSVYVNLGDGIIIEETVSVHNDSNKALNHINNLFSEILKQLTK